MGSFVLFLLVSKSFLSFTLICWCGNISIETGKSFSKTVKSVAQKLREYSRARYRTCSAHMLKSSFLTAHVLVLEFRLLPSGSRYRLPTIRSNSFRNSFVPNSRLSSERKWVEELIISGRVFIYMLSWHDNKVLLLLLITKITALHFRDSFLSCFKSVYTSSCLHHLLSSSCVCCETNYPSGIN